MENFIEIKKPSIGILLISTWKYNKFIDDTISGIRKYFFPNSTIKIFLHTDSTEQHDADIIIPTEHKPWPLIALFRYDLFNQHIDLYDTEYLFYLDIDTNIIDFVEEDILDDICVVKHGCFINKRGLPETNPKSTAYIAPEEELVYVCSGFLGGKTNHIKKMMKQININTKIDYENNIIARWHDESHLNRYVQTYKTIINIKLLPSCYMKHMLCNEQDKIKMIAYSNHAKGFDKFENMVHK